MKILVTGAAGLVGTECCKLFASNGWEVISVDNYLRAGIFGSDADTKVNIKKTIKAYGLEHHEIDIRDEKIAKLVERAHAIVHAAAQPSHPRSIEIPMEDFQINTLGACTTRKLHSSIVRLTKFMVRLPTILLTKKWTKGLSQSTRHCGMASTRRFASTR